MRKFLPMIAAAVLVTLAQSAHAEIDEVSGKIHNIDLIRNTFSVGDKSFQWSSMNSMGVQLKQLEAGDQVKVVYDTNQDGTNDVMDMHTEQ